MAVNRSLLASAVALSILSIGSPVNAIVPRPYTEPPFATPAPIAYLVDLSSGAVLLDKGAKKRILPASMTKMMTAYVVFDLVEQGKVKLDQPITVKPEVWKIWHARPGASTMYLSPGDKVNVGDLLAGALTLSGNDACMTLAEGIAGSEQGFATQMNAVAKKIGLKNSHFASVTGWPDKGATYTTAEDLATLAVATIRDHPALYKRFYGQPGLSWKGVIQRNRDPILGRIAGADGLKTGHTAESGFSFTGSALHDGRRLVMVIAGMDSEVARLSESVRMMEWGYKRFYTQALFDAGTVVGTARVQQGSLPGVSLATEHPVSITQPKGEMTRARIAFRYQGPIKAPIVKGQRIADLVVTTPGLKPQVMPLVAGNDVAEAGFFQRALNGLFTLLGR